MVKESVDLGLYFERIMRECEIDADEWVEKLYSRLSCAYVLMREEVRKQLGSLEMCVVIERCDGPWASPLVAVRKQDRGVRVL